MAARRPYGFNRYIGKQGFHGLYLVTTEVDSPVKIGITADMVKRFAGLQQDNFNTLRLHRFWWLAGHPIAWRIESEFKDHFQSHNIRGEWYRLPLEEAERFVVNAIRSIGTWSIRQDEMVDLMDQWERKKCDLPPEAPSPLGGYSGPAKAKRRVLPGRKTYAGGGGAGLRY